MFGMFNGFSPHVHIPECFFSVAVMCKHPEILTIMTDNADRHGLRSRWQMPRCLSLLHFDREQESGELIVSEKVGIFFYMFLLC